MDAVLIKARNNTTLSLHFGLTLNSPSKQNKSYRLRCASFTQKQQQQHQQQHQQKHSLTNITNTNNQSRRSISIAALLLFNSLSVPKHAIAGAFDNYIKRKKLDPLEVYVPPVILTLSQIKNLGKTLEGYQPEYAACRSVLRSGPAASLRVNIRAVAQYAAETGKGKVATDDVDQCLRALEDLDSLLLRASRNDKQASVELMEAKIVDALGALDSLLQTVPSAVLDKGKAIADAYSIAEDVEPENLDPEMKQLQSIL